MLKLAAFAAIALTAAVAVARTVNDDKVTAPQDCAKDGTLIINANHDSIELNGTCAVVTINGNFATIHGSAQKITVNGNDNTVHAETVGELSLQGNRNTVTWKAGVKGDPHVTNLGKNNAITQQK